jgi:hypothetical protein
MQGINCVLEFFCRKLYANKLYSFSRNIVAMRVIWVTPNVYYKVSPYCEGVMFLRNR